MKKVSFKARVPHAYVVEVFQTGGEDVLFDETFLAEKFGKVTWLNLQRALSPY